MYFLAGKGWCKSTVPAQCRCLDHQQVQCEKTDLWTLSLAGLSLEKNKKKKKRKPSVPWALLKQYLELSNEIKLSLKQSPELFLFIWMLPRTKNNVIPNGLVKMEKIAAVEHCKAPDQHFKCTFFPFLLWSAVSRKWETITLCWFPQWAALPVSNLSFSTVKWEIMFSFFFPVTQAVILLLLQQWMFSPPSPLCTCQTHTETLDLSSCR